MQELKTLLANTYALYLKTQNFHWNVEGREFFELHELFGRQYLKLADDIDIIAEIIRMLGFKVTGNFQEFSQNSQIKDAQPNTNPESMIIELNSDYKLVIEQIKKCIETIDNSEYGIVHRLVSILENYQKTAWMLSSWSK